jgi:DNA (cytosine-5)-methyltransferase 1
MTAYYNEYDPVAAAWLRELIKAGHIADGVVDERSIEDVPPNELAGFTQCHFFAGIGVWSFALRRAGWPDDRPVWTGSCPCQPFSAAGKGAGFADERNLWPAFHHLIEWCRPATVFGEQVAGKAVDDWIDLVHADLESVGYAFGSVPFPAAGIGAPHIRDRLYWVADASSERLQRGKWGWQAGTERVSGGHPSKCHATCGLGNTINEGLEGFAWDGNGSDEPGRIGAQQGGSATEAGPIVRPGPTNGFWRDADWLFCRDAKWRPVEPGTVPLVDGATARVGRLRGYGNAINAEAAKAFIETYLEIVA